MRNWSTDIKNLKKDPIRFAIWQLEQAINFGLEGNKLNKQILDKYWTEIAIDPGRRAYLGHLLYAS